MRAESATASAAVPGVHERAGRARRRSLSSTQTPSVSPAMRSCSPARRQVARRRVESTMPPAHRPSTWTASAPRDRLDRLERVEHRAGVGVEPPVGVALVRVAPGDREHLLAGADGVLDHAAAGREVGDVVLVDHRRDDAAAAARAPAASAARTGGARTARRASDDRARRDREVLADRERRAVDHRRDARRPRHVAREVARAAHEVAPAGVERAFSAAGLRSGKFVGASASSTFSAAKRTRRSRAPVEPGVADQAVDRAARREVGLEQPAEAPGCSARRRP